MKRLANPFKPTDYLSASHHTCELCLGHLVRTPRRTIDHLLNLLVPVYRYRCSRYACQWTGNLRVTAGPTSARPLTPR